MDWLAIMVLRNRTNTRNCTLQMVSRRSKLFTTILVAAISSRLTTSQAFTSSTQKQAHLPVQTVARNVQFDDTSRLAQSKTGVDGTDPEQVANLGRFYKVQPKWEGSSYSYVRPRKRSRKDTTDATKENLRSESNMNGTMDANTSERLSLELKFPNCGRVVLRQDPSLVADHGVSGTGHTLWSAALAISSHLDANFELASNASEDVPMLGNRKIISCLELGAELGLPSIVAARHGVPRVTATDTDAEPDVMEALERSMRQNLNEEVYERCVSVKELDWTYPEDEFIKEEAPDLIILSDVIWNATRPSWPDLFELLNRLRNNSLALKDEKERADPLVLIGYTQRRLDMTVEEEKEFFDLVRSSGMEAKPIPSAASDNWPLTVVYELGWAHSKDI